MNNPFGQLEVELAKLPEQIKHGAAWLVGAVISARQDLQDLRANDPLVDSAIRVGEAAAMAHGFPLTAIENAGAAILQAAQAMAAPAPPPTTAAPAARVAGALASWALLIGLGASLVACAPGTAGGNGETLALTGIGASASTAATVVADANFGATLACQLGPEIVAVTNIKVTGAQAQAIAAACEQVLEGSSPAPAPAGAVLPAVTAPAATVAAVAASVGTGS